MTALHAPVLRRQLESAGFRYHRSLSAYVNGDLRQVLTDRFVETAHRDDVERAVRSQNTGWVIHSVGEIPEARTKELLEAAQEATG